MIKGHVVFTNSDLTTEAGLVSLGQHTYALYIANYDGSDWVEVRLNGGPHSVWVPPAASGTQVYMEVPGDYTQVQVVTAASAVRIYAIG